MSNEISIPGTLTLGGVTYNVAETPELQSFLQQVSSAEKNKLYSQFNNLKNQVEQLKMVQPVAPQQSAPQSNVPMDINAMLQQQGFVTKNELTAALSEALKPLIDNSNASKEKDLAEYRESLIQQNLATCIPDLVKGNTREEIDKSLQESIRIRKSLPTPENTTIAKQENVEVKPITQTTTAQPQSQNVENNENNNVVAPQTQQQVQVPAQQTPVQTIPTPPATKMPEGGGYVSPMEMTIEEFSKQRDRLLNELRQTIQ